MQCTNKQVNSYQQLKVFTYCTHKSLEHGLTASLQVQHLGNQTGINVYLAEVTSNYKITTVTRRIKIMGTQKKSTK